MADITLILDDDEPIEQVQLEDDLTDMDLVGDSFNEVEEAVDEAEAPDDPEDDDFKLDCYDDLGIVDDDEDDEEDQVLDPEYDDNVIGQKRKRVKPTFAAQTNRALQRSTLRTKADNGDPFILDEDTVLVTKPSSRVPGTFGRRDRKKGETLPAYHKRVSHELDSDDELMMNMREKGFSDRQIADKLAKDGRVRYDQKSISTRIMRIRLAQADNVDFLLREGYKEWEFEDDSLLMQAYALADIEINYEIERMRAWRFRKVSEYMRRLHKDALFSATACRERYNALSDGTARIPTDLDDDPDARRFELETYRETREQARNKEQAEKDTKEAIQRKTKDEARTRNAQKSEEIAYKRQQKEEEKAQRAMHRAAAAQVRSQRAKEHATARAQRNAQIKKQNDAAAKKANKGKNRAVTSPKKVSFSSDALTLSNSKVTADTPDPRGYLNDSDLVKMCANRGLDTAGKVKHELLDSLKDADDEWSQSDLKKMCRTKGLNASGGKLQMKYHLALAAAQACGSFQEGFNAAQVEDEKMDVDEE
ncbi:hypothetical protein BKA63DRAFT_467568 [Paraphoma chrysanthemicola]|nr:hypothetical protein BKA63DRAFT_467568 [Paraphoma chrysanthemicola]